MAWRVLSSGLVATFFFLAMMLGVLPFVTGLALGRPLQAVIGGVLAAFFLVAAFLTRTRRLPR